MSHTPGPWRARIYEAHEGRAEEFVIDSLQWKELALVYVQDQGDDLFGSGEANAQLMAAAPDLLKVAEEAYAAASKMGWSDKMAAWGEAIAKARRKQ